MEVPLRELGNGHPEGGRETDCCQVGSHCPTLASAQLAVGVWRALLAFAGVWATRVFPATRCGWHDSSWVLSNKAT